MPECVICGGVDFYAEAGFYFCKECQTQNEDVREEVLELKVDLATRVRKIRIRRDKSDASEQNLGWTTWEQYNFVLIGMTNELIELGASMNVKMTILQLWAFYLKKIEVAFTSTKKKSVPKLARKFHKRDAEIIYGKIAQHKRNRRRGAGSNSSAPSMTSAGQSEGSSNRDINKRKKQMIAAEYERFVQSQDSSEGDALSVMNQSLFSVQSSAGKSSTQTEDNVRFNKAAKIEFEKVKVLSMKLPRLQRLKYRQKHVTTQYKIGPQVITPMKLWTLIYLALRIHDDNIHLADMLRYGREGHLSYYRLDHLLPPEVTLTRKETNLLHQTKEITHKGMRQSVGTMAKFLHVWETINPNLLSLIERYCIELQLPKGIAIYAGRMMAMSPPKMSFDAKTACFPNYEGRSMAFIIVVVKILFALDGITEYEISRVVEKINRDDAGNISFASLPSEIIEPCVIVHGGIAADYSLNPVFVEMVEACKISASLGYQKILSGGNSVDAVETALWWLENDEFFNCGYGSVVNNEGYVEMDACLMNGTRLECGSVVAIRDLEHPISLARYVMENYPNTIVGANSAKRLAKFAGIKSILPESIISPASYFANEIKYPPSMGYFDDDRRDNESAGILKTGNLGAAGCIAWDGRTIVAGTSTGGTRGQMVGRVGDSSLMGCGTFANQHCGCCLTGHGESIIKMGLARAIVDSLTFENFTPREALKKHLNDVSSMLGQQTGGIVLRKDGTFGVYSTNESRNPMPYAVAKNQLITWTSEDGEQRMEKYRDPKKERLCKCDNESLAAATRGELESRLFSFVEWQRYIECRRKVLTTVHFPTKFKRDPDAPGNGNLYLKFLAAVRAKSSDREEPEVTSYKHLIPRELADAMKNIIGKLNDTGNSVEKNVDIFSPSLTPQYSYLQQLLEDPETDLPSELRTDFNSTKVGHMTKSEALRALAAWCNIDLDIQDTGIHFIEKIIPTFEQSNLPNIQEFNEIIRVEKPVSGKTHRGYLTSEFCENAVEYLHRKNPGRIFVDSSKRNEYDAARKTSEQRRCESTTDLSDDFGFDEVFPSGKLCIRNDDDSDSECSRSIVIDNESRRNSKDKDQSTVDSLAEYNLDLSNFEKRSLAGNLGNNAASSRVKKTKRKVAQHPVTGKFISIDSTNNFEETKVVSSKTRDRRKVTPCEMEKSATIEESSRTNERRDDEMANKSPLDSSLDFGLNDDDISILHETSFNSLNENAGDDDDDHDDDSSCNEDNRAKEVETLFRPYTDYWMLRCNFSRVKQKSFRQLETNLPENFRWLLKECSSVIEMTEEDLYEEVCLVEAYYADILRPTKYPLTRDLYDNEEYRSKAHCNAVRKKW